MKQITTRKRNSRPSGAPRLALLVVALIVVVGAATYLARVGGDERGGAPHLPGDERQDAAPPEDAPHTATNTGSIAAVKSGTTSSPPTAAASTNDYVRKPGQMMTDDGRILTFPAPKPGEFRTVHSHGKIYKCDSEGNWEDVTPKPIFDNSFEECLVGLSVEGGSFIPGMLMGLDEATVRKMLEKPVVIAEDDPEDVVAKKEAVAEMKSIILDYMDEGGSFDQFVLDMHAFTSQERMLRGKGLVRLSELIRAGQLEEARAYLETYNDVLSKQGFSPMKLPPFLSEALGGAK